MTYQLDTLKHAASVILGEAAGLNCLMDGIQDTGPANRIRMKLARERIDQAASEFSRALNRVLEDNCEK